ncbi:uncharacterized protein LOC107312810 isoform X3 [Coturnix japonica]|uniref:uncharacterized protein LOC107312810 isoform X3 n=1 Tax=Coturnix japonica TaxID=93934 RepID=UPI0013A5CAB5|nr:uncharacterized protein LOC107312810 isoform X3 [Coturnix japonica]
MRTASASSPSGTETRTAFFPIEIHLQSAVLLIHIQHMAGFLTVPINPSVALNLIAVDTDEMKYRFRLPEKVAEYITRSFF